MSAFNATVVQIGDVVLVDPGVRACGNCLMTVEDVRSWGVFGVAQSTADPDRCIPMRLGFDEIAAVYRKLVPPTPEAP